MVEPIAALKKSNLVLIGMPAAGKSTVGRLLSESASMPFVDTDRLVERAACKSLRDLISEDGVEAFRRLEQECILSLKANDTVIATGGSVVYSSAAMEHLAARGLVVFLDAPMAELEQRLADMQGRAVVRRDGQSVAELTAERRPLYERWAELTLPCSAANIPEVVARIRDLLAVDGRSWRLV